MPPSSPARCVPCAAGASKASVFAWTGAFTVLATAGAAAGAAFSTFFGRATVDGLTGLRLLLMLVMGGSCETPTE